jgi:predicted nucleotidyltransferase
MREALIERLAPRLSAVPGLRLALLFGSQARGTSRPDSDIDVAVAGKGIDGLAIAGELSAELDREV